MSRTPAKSPYKDYFEQMAEIIYAERAIWPHKLLTHARQLVENAQAARDNLASARRESATKRKKKAASQHKRLFFQAYEDRVHRNNKLSIRQAAIAIAEETGYSPEYIRRVLTEGIKQGKVHTP
jgi:hypothetical protein